VFPIGALFSGALTALCLTTWLAFDEGVAHALRSRSIPGHWLRARNFLRVEHRDRSRRLCRVSVRVEDPGAQWRKLRRPEIRVSLGVRRATPNPTIVPPSNVSRHFPFPSAGISSLVHPQSNFFVGATGVQRGATLEHPGWLDVINRPSASGAEPFMSPPQAWNSRGTHSPGAPLLSFRAPVCFPTDSCEERRPGKWF